MALPADLDNATDALLTQVSAALAANYSPLKIARATISRVFVALGKPATWSVGHDSTDHRAAATLASQS